MRNHGDGTFTSRSGRISDGGVRKIARRRMLPGLAQIAPPEIEQATSEAKPGRNDPCPCESGKKFKRCCLGVETIRCDGSGVITIVLDIPPLPPPPPGKRWNVASAGGGAVECPGCDQCVEQEDDDSREGR